LNANDRGTILKCDYISHNGIDMRTHIKLNRLRGLPADVLHGLIAARHARHWTQRDLASKVGLPQVHISAIETGKVAPRFNTLLDLVRVLGYDLLLVPRPLVPAVQSLIRDSQRSGRTDAEEGERPLYATEEDRGHDEP
jgi:transcriptional regulator with XRE-family HTH domain